jgi:O-antigen/teichoic acid export membrane protein
VIFGGVVTHSVLAGVGETKILLKLSLLNLSLGIPLAFILIPTYGITGVILVSFVPEIPSLFIVLYWMKKHYNTNPDFKISAKIFLAAIIAAVATYSFLDFIFVTYWMKLVIGVAIFLSVYIFFAPLLGAISKTDIQTLRTVFSSLELISKLINIPLTLVEKVLTLRNS